MFGERCVLELRDWLAAAPVLVARSMCGIAGLLGAAGLDRRKALSQALAHRGPDDAGFFEDADCGVLLVHRRLSILDLSPAGHQPMADASGRYVLCYNGEIYNHLELRSELQAQGASFRGTSDSETLIEGFARWGADILPRLNGIFALAIWDSEKRELHLARDGVGVKPLYWTRLGEGVAFASELKALATLHGLDRTIDPVAVRAYVQYLWSPGERTMFSAVRKLAPGTVLTVDLRGGASERRFWSLPAYAPQGLADGDAIAATRSELRAAVGRQMLADVEIGAFLSGGLDSSSIAFFAREFTDRPLQCFTIGYAATNREADELVPDLPYARSTAAALGVPLHEVEVGAWICDELADLVSILDEPEADPAALNNLHISALARKHGIKVLLSGAGGDDIFSGYRRHSVLSGSEKVDRLPGALRGLAGRAAPLFAGRSAFRRRASRVLDLVASDPEERLLRSFEWVDDAALRAICDDDLAGDPQRAPLKAIAEATRGWPALERALRIDQSFFLADHNLNYTDKTGMACGVEIRVPFLDHRLMHFASGLSADQKLRGRTTKWVLRKAMEGLLPHATIYRPKTGFGVPLRAWLSGPLREMVADLTAPDTIVARGLFDAKAVADWRDATLSGRIDGAYPLLALMVVELWCRAFCDSVPRQMIFKPDWK